MSFYAIITVRKETKGHKMTKENIKELFKNIESLADAKKTYKNLAKKLHPDVGGTEESFKNLNEIYNKFISNDLYFTSEIKFDLELEKIISQILHYENIEIEIVGSWIWVGGDTKSIKEVLKNLGFKWASKKKLWFHGEMKSKNTKSKSMKEIKNKYGFTKVNTKSNKKLVA